MYEQDIGDRAIAMKFGVVRSTVQYIIRLYREHGKNALKDKSKNRRHSPEFKFNLVKRALAGEPKLSLAIEYGINDGTIYAWCKKYEQLGYNGLKQDLRGAHVKKIPKTTTPTKPVTTKDKVKQLEEENKQLKMELDLLKKLNALVQQRKERQNKKK